MKWEVEFQLDPTGEPGIMMLRHFAVNQRLFHILACHLKSKGVPQGWQTKKKSEKQTIDQLNQKTQSSEATMASTNGTRSNSEIVVLTMVDILLIAPLSMTTAM